MPSHKKPLITAIIYDKRGRVLSIGRNSYVKTHPYQKKLADKVGLPLKVFIHAEIHAILKCKKLEKAHSIFISRYDDNGNPMLAKPCPICAEALKQVGIKNIQFTIGEV
jgi:tRNA(Arg) A34 adenosine deaminase TadA